MLYEKKTRDKIQILQVKILVSILQTHQMPIITYSKSIKVKP